MEGYIHIYVSSLRGYTLDSEYIMLDSKYLNCKVDSKCSTDDSKYVSSTVDSNYIKAIGWKVRT